MIITNLRPHWDHREGGQPFQWRQLQRGKQQAASATVLTLLWVFNNLD